MGMNKTIEVGIAKLLKTTNPRFKKYENRKGSLLKITIPETDEYAYFFDMIRYYIRTTLVKKTEFRDCGIEKCKMIVTTLNSVYQFEVVFSEEYLSVDEALKSIKNINNEDL